MASFSNPVNASEKLSGASFLAVATRRRRQDLSFLEGQLDKCTRLSPQFHLPIRDIPEIKSTGKGDMQRAKTQTFDVPDNFEKLPPIPNSKLTRNGELIQKGNLGKRFYNSQKTFGGKNVPDNLRQTIRHALATRIEINGPAVESCVIADELMATGLEWEYSAGTTQGLVERLSRFGKDDKTVSFFRQTDEIRNFQSFLFQALDTLLPLKSTPFETSFPSTSTEVIEGIRVNPQSSAGPMYGTTKVQALDDIMLTMDAIRTQFSLGTLDTFFAAHPETLIADCRNKTDRYEIAKLPEKTRPYWSFNAHWQFYYSWLMQRFCDNLYVASDPECDVPTYNYYGHVWAKGGAQRIHESIMNVAKTGRPFVGIYGDDFLFAFPIKTDEGTTIQVMAPDISQMDSTVSHAVIRGTCDYIYKQYQEAHGDDPFVRFLLTRLAEDASSPRFLASAIATYQNQRPTGLATGVVGTTLFDTVQAALLAFSVIEEWNRTKRSPDEIFNKVSKKFGMRAKSLELYEYNGLPPAEGTEWTFLGMQLATYSNSKHTNGVIPRLPRDSLLKSILNPRINSYLFSSKLGTQRYLFDASRGWYLCALGDRLIWDVLSSVIETVPTMAVGMVVQAGGGLGAPPECNGLFDVNRPFNWLSSFGVPTMDWVADLFLSPMDPDPAGWLSLLDPPKGRLIVEMQDQVDLSRYTIRPTPNTAPHSWETREKVTDTNLESLVSDNPSGLGPQVQRPKAQHLPPVKAPPFKIRLSEHLSKHNITAFVPSELAAELGVSVTTILTELYSKERETKAPEFRWYSLGRILTKDPVDTVQPSRILWNQYSRILSELGYSNPAIQPARPKAGPVPAPRYSKMKANVPQDFATSNSTTISDCDTSPAIRVSGPDQTPTSQTVPQYTPKPAQMMYQRIPAKTGAVVCALEENLVAPRAEGLSSGARVPLADQVNSGRIVHQYFNWDPPSPILSTSPEQTLPLDLSTSESVSTPDTTSTPDTVMYRSPPIEGSQCYEEDQSDGSESSWTSYASSVSGCQRFDYPNRRSHPDAFPNQEAQSFRAAKEQYERYTESRRTQSPPQSPPPRWPTPPPPIPITEGSLTYTSVSTTTSNSKQVASGDRSRGSGAKPKVSTHSKKSTDVPSQVPVKSVEVKGRTFTNSTRFSGVEHKPVKTTNGNQRVFYKVKSKDFRHPPVPPTIVGFYDGKHNYYVPTYKCQVDSKVKCVNTPPNPTKLGNFAWLGSGVSSLCAWAVTGKFELVFDFTHQPDKMLFQCSIYIDGKLMISASRCKSKKEAKEIAAFQFLHSCFLHRTPRDLIHHALKTPH
ncbi:RdRp [Beihai sphaeromadae virus 4]|uniref:RdRp n=1 Tax=Beihai sphaeromadae virus 4 TaxID=1922710 RepID=UPI00090AF82D|nr:RdRp [Beihai sphaeromadae virus 4]APG76921.1 RdRp [Beihai sphaeromadae virus 4]